MRRTLLLALLALLTATCSADDEDGTPPTSGATSTSAATSTAGSSTVPATTEPPSEIAIEVDPSAGLADADIVVVAVSGARPESVLVVGQCRGDALDPLADCEPHVAEGSEGTLARSDADGAAELRIRVRARFTTGTGQVVDCRAEAAGCQLVVASVFSPDLLGDASARLEFDPDAPLAEPALFVTPTEDLVDGQRLAVELVGMPPEAAVAIGQCVTETRGDGDGCDLEIAVTAPRRTTDRAGGISTSIRARAVYEAYDAGPIDCRELPDGCVLVVEVLDTETFTFTRRLHFDPDAPLAPPPAIEVTPDQGLTDGQQVEVTGEVLDAGGWLVQCDGGFRDTGDCATSTAWFVTHEMVDTFDVEIVVHALIETLAGETVDCRSAPDACVLVYADPDAALRTWGTADLDFAPGAPLVAPPEITIEPPGPYVDRQPIVVIGEGFEPGRPLDLVVCSDTVGVPRCADRRTLTVAPDGGLRVELTALAETPLGTDSVEPLDCSTPGSCVVRVEQAIGWDPVPRLITSTPLTVAPVSWTVRYLEPVFDDVETTRALVYGRGRDADGNEVDLTVDVIVPAGDTMTQRPVLVGMDLETSIEFARRGFVALRPDYRQGAGNSRAGALLAYDNALELFGWIEAQAEALGIDPAKVAMGGSSFGGITALNVAYLPNAAEGETSPLAAAISIAGFGSPPNIERSEPPALLLHGDADGRIPIGLAEETCTAAEAVDVECELVVYEGRGHALSVLGADRWDIWQRTGAFLVEHLGL